MSSRQLRLRSLSKRLAEPSVWQAILSMALLIAVVGAAATVRRPASIGLGNPKHDFFSGPLIESRQQSGLVAKPYWDRVRIALTIKSKPANPAPRRVARARLAHQTDSPRKHGKHIRSANLSDRASLGSNFSSDR